MDLNISTDKHLEKIRKKFEFQRITGSDILKITEFHQLNLFILKNIYDQWKSNFETNKIKYFNYESQDVLEIINKLMNILSNNISIEADSFNELFKKSANQVISLIKNPKEYIKKDLVTEEWYDTEKINMKAKYYAFHKKIFQLIIDKMKENNEMTIRSSEIINYLDNITIDTNENLISKTCDFFECSKESIFSTKRNKKDIHYSFFPLSKEKVDNLLFEAISQNEFKDAMSLILKNLDNKYKKNLSDKALRNFFRHIKEKMSLSS